jgi:hypothetical protein
MKDIDFINALKSIKQNGGNLKDIPVMLKIDGFGFTIGKDAYGYKYVKTSNSGRIYHPTEFLDYIQDCNINDPIRIKRAEQYKKLADFFISDVVSPLDKLPNNHSIKMEVFVTDMGEVIGDYIKFVHIAYPKSVIGSEYTFFPHSVYESGGAFVSDKSPEIIETCFRGFEYGDQYVTWNPTISFKDVNIVKELSWVFEALDIPNLERIIVSRKKSDKEQKESIKHVLQERKDLFSDFLISNANNTDRLGELFEGIIFDVDGKSYKITTSEFKELMKQ